MRQSEMNQWVGDGDPELIGDICTSFLLRHIPINGGERVLDFGCGIGRVALALLRQRPNIALTGIDIVPRLTEFCGETFTAHFPHVNFELLADRNEHYERFKHDAPLRSNVTSPRSHIDLIANYGGRFDVAYAFSVLTHTDVGDFVDVLRLVKALLKPTGSFLFTAFALTPYSRQQIANKATKFPLIECGQYEQDGDVYIGNMADRLVFVGYDIRRIETMIWEAGLVSRVVEYGDWRGDKISQCFQDIFVCHRPPEDNVISHPENGNFRTFSDQRRRQGVSEESSS
jgi:SAM-dependent methyltransferase